jgi:hypothetical protein
MVDRYRRAKAVYEAVPKFWRDLMRRDPPEITATIAARQPPQRVHAVLTVSESPWHRIDFARRWVIGIIAWPLRRLWGLKIPPWLDGAVDTLPVLDVVALFIGWVALLIAASTGQPWLFPVVWWGAALAIIVCAGHWAYKYLREVKDSPDTATRLLIVALVVAVVPGSFMIQIVNHHNQPTQSASLIALNPRIPTATHNTPKAMPTPKITQHPKVALPVRVATLVPPTGAQPTTAQKINSAVSPRPISTRAPRSLFALKGSQFNLVVDGQPMDAALKINFQNGGPGVASHFRVWMAPVYYDDLAGQPGTMHLLNQFDPEILGPSIATPEFSIGNGETLPVPVGGFRVNHQLRAPGVQAVYVYYVYVDESGDLHEPIPDLFIFYPGIPGFRGIGLDAAFPADVQRELLQMGRQRVDYSYMIATFGQRR